MVESAGDTARARARRRRLRGDLDNIVLKTLAKGKSGLRPWSALGIGVWGNALLEDRKEALPADVVQALRSAMIDEKNPDRFGAYAIACGMVRDGDSERDLHASDLSFHAPHRPDLVVYPSSTAEV